MPPDPLWAFVDDQAEEAESFAHQLSEGERGILVRVLPPSSARSELLTGLMNPAGVLMDVELSAATGEHGTGLGIAQDLRAKQRASEIGDFPIVRFAQRDRIARIIGGDPASDELFDLRIEKGALSRDPMAVQRSLHGVRKLYDELTGSASLDAHALSALLGLTTSQMEEWSHAALHTRLADGRQIAVHAAAGVFMRSLIGLAGLLIDETLLGIRLGLDIGRSRDDWAELLGRLAGFKFSGAGHEEFERWWARGLEDWWLKLSGGNSLASLTISERHEILSSKLGLHNLRPLVMPEGSAGARPWRMCTLSAETDESQCVPVDPTSSVRLVPRADQPPWVDPFYAALGPALRAPNDNRLNRSDLARLQPTPRTAR